MKRNRLELTGRVFGRLTVLRRDDTSTGKRGKWICQCCCAAKTIRSIVSYSLTSGKTTSCGCVCREISRKRALERNKSPFNRLPYGQASFNSLISAHKARARDTARTWELSDDDARLLFKGDCFYCGKEPLQQCSRRKSNGAYKYNGIDRVNNDWGYIKNNVVSCCGACNWMKRHMSPTVFFLHIKSIYHRRFSQTVSSAFGNSAGLLF